MNTPRQQAFIDELIRLGQATTVELAPLLGQTGHITSNIGTRLVRKGLIWSRPIHGKFYVYFARQEDAEAFVPPESDRARLRAGVGKRKKGRPGIHQAAGMAAVAAAGADGLNVPEAALACGVARTRISPALQSLAVAGLIFTRRVGRFYRYFQTQAFADAWEQPPKPAKEKRVRPPRKRPETAKQGRTPYAVVKEKPTVEPTVKVKNHGRQKLSGDTIYPASFKTIVAKPPSMNRWISDESSVPREFSLKYELEKASA